MCYLLKRAVEFIATQLYRRRVMRVCNSNTDLLTRCFTEVPVPVCGLLNTRSSKMNETHKIAHKHVDFNTTVHIFQI